jgi:solute carrier family 25 (mitochondrial folate transporter), member 32
VLQDPREGEDMPTGKWTSSPSTLAGAGAGLVSSILTCPLDVIKTKVQAAKGGVDYVGVLGSSPSIVES